MADADGRTTRERLTDAAIDLFSTKGYDATSVDEIARAAGTKGPNLYKHFRSKQALLEAVTAYGDERYERGMERAYTKADDVRTARALKEFTMAQLNFTFTDEVIRKLRRILTIEQFRDETLARSATRHQLTRPQGLYARVFANMMDQGTMPMADAELLAFEFIAPITLLIQLADRDVEALPRLLKAAERHMDQFIGTYVLREESS